ncbi:hypothetical protein OH779_01245 [Actinacidiphila glaucinigra]|uniref:hypothetical protein n=1 Tax=Actinacidiphila glaucinigra TaxID=235986 RepID=UPI003864FAF5
MVLRTDRAFGDLLPDLIAADVAMWTTVDPAVVHLLRAAHRASTRMVLLSKRATRRRGRDRRCRVVLQPDVPHRLQRPDRAQQAARQGV